jgi:hypothetical protein
MLKIMSIAAALKIDMRFIPLSKELDPFNDCYDAQYLNAIARKVSV